MNNKKEVWKTFTIDGKKPSVAYAISNFGRFGVMGSDGKVQVRRFKPTAGTYRFNTRQNGRNKAVFLSREVAKAFLKRPSSKHTQVIHKDHNYLNDHVDNLKWATVEEHRRHTSMSPKAVMARNRKAIVKSSHSTVMDEKTATALKKMIWDPKRTLSFKQLAEKFGVSEMQIYRLKKGQFWYHIRVPHEPLHAKYKRNLTNLAWQEKQAAVKASVKKKAPGRPIKQRANKTSRKK